MYIMAGKSSGNGSGSGSTQNFKVVLLGEGCVGKTSLVLRYVEDKFNSNHVSTVQVRRTQFYLQSATVATFRLRF